MGACDFGSASLDLSLFIMGFMKLCEFCHCVLDCSKSNSPTFGLGLSTSLKLCGENDLVMDSFHWHWLGVMIDSFRKENRKSFGIHFIRFLCLISNLAFGNLVFLEF